jgi:soluble lytic murein transglycosylase-like protein
MIAAAAAPPPRIVASDVTGVARWRPWIAQASSRFAVPQAWITAVMRVESGGRLTLGGRPITSRAGALGLMQLMPSTWQALRHRYGLGADPYAPRDNILAGTAYLRWLYIRYGYPNLFAAYNAGPGRLEAHLASRTPLPSETRAYLGALGQPVLGQPVLGQPGLESPGENVPAAVAISSGLFFPLRSPGAPAAHQGPSALFVPLTTSSPPQD